jgi:hypothetical protein
MRKRLIALLIDLYLIEISHLVGYAYLSRPDTAGGASDYYIPFTHYWIYQAILLLISLILIAMNMFQAIKSYRIDVYYYYKTCDKEFPIGELAKSAKMCISKPAHGRRTTLWSETNIAAATPISVVGDVLGKAVKWPVECVEWSVKSLP